MDDYRLFVNEDRTVMVRIWAADDVTQQEVMEVATREHRDAIWGPPVAVREER